VAGERGVGATLDDAVAALDAVAAVYAQPVAGKRMAA
jgi:hypothetical protein